MATPAGRLYAAGGGLVRLAFAAMSLLIGGAAAYTLLGSTQPRPFFLLYACLPALCMVLGAVYLPGHRPGQRVFLALLLLAALALKGVVALAVDPGLESDFYLLHYAAAQLAQGNNILNDTTYFQLWPYQSFFVALMAGAIKLFGDVPTLFRVCNALCSALTNGLVYLLARRFASERGARLAALLFLLYPGTYFLIPLLTNQHLSELLLLAGLWVYTGTGRRVLRGGAAGVLLALSNGVRPMAVVAALAVCACLVLEVLRPRQPEGPGLLARLAPGVCLLAVYFLGGKLLSGLVMWTGLNQYGLTNQAPEWKFILGLNEQTLGRYSDADAAAVFGSGLNRQALEDLYEQRTAISLPRLLVLMAQKVRLMWGGFEDASWVLNDTYLARLEELGLGELVPWCVDKLQRLAAGCYIAVGILGAGGALSALRGRKPLPQVQLLLTLTALAYFCAHLLIEIQVRYRSTMTVLLLILAAAGFDWLGALFRRRRHPA